MSHARACKLCGHRIAPNPPPSPPSPPPPSVPPAQGASGGITIHFPPPPAPPGGFGDAPCPALAVLGGRGPVAHCGDTHLQSVCDKTYVDVGNGGYQPCVFEFGACHHGDTLTCSPPSPAASATAQPEPATALPLTPLPCPELAHVWGREITSRWARVTTTMATWRSATTDTVAQ